MNVRVVICTMVVCLALAGPTRAYVVPPGAEEVLMAPGAVYDSLIISGTLIFARYPADPGTRTIIITNGDFVLASGGSISQVFDYAGSSTDGSDGDDGTESSPAGGNGGAGTGYGTGGAGGLGATSGNPANPYGGNGGAGGKGGMLGGAGGVGGSGGDGDTTVAGNGANAGSGGAGGMGGNGANAFTVTICNTACDGNILVHSTAIGLQGGDAGDGGDGGDGGAGGDSDFDAAHLGGVGGAAGAGGAGGAGGVGGTLTLTASNGIVRIPAFAAWLRGGAGGAGGAGGTGGDGGLHATPPGGSASAGAGGNGGNAGNGGNGGTLNVTAGAIYTSDVRVTSMTLTTVANGGASGAPGVPGFSGGIPPVPGTPGAPGSVGASGSLSLLPDLLAPTAPAGSPFAQPAPGAVLLFSVRTNLQFVTAGFGDNLTRSNCLRQTLEVVPTNAANGVALGAPLVRMRNTPANALTNFVPQQAWTNRVLCFRFLTYDAGDNVRTSVYPNHVFSVIPEPCAVVLWFGLMAWRRRTAKT
jgi:hypothetical protein